MNGPTVTMSSILSKIAKSEYIIIPGTTVTICTVTLKNGFVVTGESACASPENFNVAEGDRYAFEKCINKIWELEGYLLKEKLYQDSLN
jgi:hypothetical protein